MLPNAAEGMDPVRLQKLEALRAAGRDPFAAERFAVTHLAAAVIAGFEPLEGQTVSLAGRIMAVRVQG